MRQRIAPPSSFKEAVHARLYSISTSVKTARLKEVRTTDCTRSARKKHLKKMPQLQPFPDDEEYEWSGLSFTIFTAMISAISIHTTLPKEAIAPGAV